MNFDPKSSRTFCILPWLHVRIQQDGFVYPCCRQKRFHSYGSLKEETFEEIWNGEAVRNLRLRMLKGERIDFCEGCYSVESAGGESLRQSSNKRYEHCFDRLERTGTDGTLSFDDRVLYLDLRFSNLCNLRCRSCGPQNSTAWYREASKIEASSYHSVSQPYDDSEAFLSMLRERIPYLDYVYFAGGEPLIDDIHYRFLESLIEANRVDVELFYNTNFTVLKHKNWDVLMLWKKFRRVHVQASLDGVEMQLELLRKGISWEGVVKNYNELVKEVEHVSFSVNPTITVMNAFHITKALETFIDLGMVRSDRHPSMNVAMDPSYLSINILNEDERENLRSCYREFLEAKGRVLSKDLYLVLKSELDKVLQSFSQEIWPEKRKEFRSFTIGLDKLRSERFIKLFPEHFNLLYES